MILFLLGRHCPPPPRGLKKSEMSLFLALFKNSILEVSQSHKFFWGVTFVCGEVRKKIGAKS